MKNGQPIDTKAIEAEILDDPTLKKGSQRCGAQLRKKPGRFCRKMVPLGRRCDIHGGTKSGAPVQHGRRSKRVGRFRAAMQEAENDPKLMDLRRSVAVMELALQRAADRIDEADTPKFRKRLNQLWVAAMEAKNNPRVQAEALNEVGKMIESGAEEDEAFKDLVVSAQRLGREQRGAWMIKLGAAHAINSRDLIAIFARFVDIVSHEVDPESTKRIVGRIEGELFPTLTPKV